MINVMMKNRKMEITKPETQGDGFNLSYLLAQDKNINTYLS